jgi:hypothetical protein
MLQMKRHAPKQVLQQQAELCPRFAITDFVAFAQTQ